MPLFTPNMNLTESQLNSLIEVAFKYSMSAEELTRNVVIEFIKTYDLENQ